MGAKAGLYCGLGAEFLSVNFEAIDYSGANSMRPSWDALVTIEVRLIVDRDEKRNDIDIPGVEDQDFERTGRFGGRISASFRNTDQGIEVQPYVQAMRPDDTDRENGIRGEDIENVSGGVRPDSVLLSWL